MSTAATTSVLPSKKRKASHDSAASASHPLPIPPGRKGSHDTDNSSSTTTNTASKTVSCALVATRPRRKGSESSWNSDHSAALELTALFDGASGSSSKASTTTATQQQPPQLLLQQQLGPPKKRKTSIDFSLSDGPLRKRKTYSSSDSASQIRPRFSSVGSMDDAALGLIPLGSSSSVFSEDPRLFMLHDTKIQPLQLPPTSAALDHLDALGDDAASISGSKISIKPKCIKGDGDSHSSSKDTMASGHQRLLFEALTMGDRKRRERFESWGGMSDMSFMGNGTLGENSLMEEGPVAAAVRAESAMQSTGDDLSVSSSCTGDADKPVPSKISLTRDRLYSVASLGDASISSAGAVTEITPEMQAYVAATMATMENQLAELAGVVETVACGAASIDSGLLRDMDRDDQSSIISTASSLPEIQAQLQAHRADFPEGRPRSMSTSSNAISVDYEAVLRAVDAATAATGALDLANFASLGSAPSSLRPDDSNSSNLLPPIPKGPQPLNDTKSERDMDAIRARARAAAGYVPPANLKPGEIPPPSLKKRPKPPLLPKSPYTLKTQHHYLPDSAYSSYNTANKASSQKWDEMYDCLVEFVDDVRKIETKGMTEKEKKEWEWDGNVPTTYKTDDGKALGRWINNQRSAKHKGSLKKDRENKLISTGLKWSVLSTNSWQDMMDELKLYVAERTKEGQEWDGNVPTNFKISGSTDEDGEEKNLGRWINRQRSLYQAGKLRKDREMELKNIGLKWSVLSTTPWQSMYETLVEYVEERKTIDGSWDGNVPSNFKTNDHPPKTLGRWINRQRTAHQKGKLKDELVEKLDSLGLKWAVHERRLPSLSSTPISQMQTPMRNNLTASRPNATLSCSTTGTSVSGLSRASDFETPITKVKADSSATPKVAMRTISELTPAVCSRSISTPPRVLDKATASIPSKAVKMESSEVDEREAPPRAPDTSPAIAIRQVGS